MADKLKDTERARRAVDQTEATTPKKGEIFRCEVCGMELEITTDCHCSDPDAVVFQCCDQDLVRA